jgi:hypothetical protein
VHTILNRTPLSADTNREVIRDRLPNAYLPELIASSGEVTVRGIMESHFISPAALAILLRNPFGPEDFEAFIVERQRTILDAMENLLIKERLDLSETLAGKLEYFDLRELQETILSKGLWQRFEPRFGTKEGLTGKFNQLAELRNGIRHSRTVDEVSRLEGEAAIQWFNKALAESGRRS